MRLKPPQLIVAGAKGAVGSTVAAAVAAAKNDPETVLPWLTTPRLCEGGSLLGRMEFAGWDVSGLSVTESIARHGVLDAAATLPLEDHLRAMPVRKPPQPDLALGAQLERLMGDIDHFRRLSPGTRPVLVNLMPACGHCALLECDTLDEVMASPASGMFPDLAYVLAAVFSGVPVVNFTSNAVEMPLVEEEALKNRVPMCGRDAKTGQTYLKVVIASALKARGLLVDGWYSLNILGNDDGMNLADHEKAAGKIANKTNLLEEILGYKVGSRYGAPSHKVVIDYYPPRGDAKEAWDVIDFSGIFGLNMSLRLNLQARDSILAAPMAMDLAWWMAALQEAGRSGLIGELAFYFKKPTGQKPPVTFQDQVAALEGLGKDLERQP